MKQAGIATTNRGTSIARTEAAKLSDPDKPFKRRRILPEYRELLDSDALRGGTDSTQIVREDRDRQ